MISYSKPVSQYLTLMSAMVSFVYSSAETNGMCILIAVAHRNVSRAAVSDLACIASLVRLGSNTMTADTNEALCIV